jgi:succinate dehydrogenase / fumarate reductase, iron-sulfur subunit
MRYDFRIFRHDPATSAEPHFQAYTIDLEPRMSVLESLITLQEQQDATLSFRCSCRGAICGSCAMTINGSPDLACRVSLGSLDTTAITVEPLSRLEVSKDLVVEMEPFWAAYEQVQPYLHEGEDAPEQEHLVSEAEAANSQPYADCVLCGCCYSACPVLSHDPSYTGPAALAKLFRFVRDPRDQRQPQDLAAVDNQSGVWGCRTILRCVGACPKNIRPVDAIRGLRRRLLGQRLRRPLGRS